MVTHLPMIFFSKIRFVFASKVHTNKANLLCNVIKNLNDYSFIYNLWTDLIISHNLLFPSAIIIAHYFVELICNDECRLKQSLTLRAQELLFSSCGCRMHWDSLIAGCITVIAQKKSSSYIRYMPHGNTKIGGTTFSPSSPQKLTAELTT